MNSRNSYAPSLYRTRRQSESRDAEQLTRVSRREACQDARALAVFYHEERILVESNWGGDWHAVTSYHYSAQALMVLESNPSGC